MNCPGCKSEVSMFSLFSFSAPFECLCGTALQIKECGHCNGYGSSLKEESETCTKCGGSGILHDPSAVQSGRLARPNNSDNRTG